MYKCDVETNSRLFQDWAVQYWLAGGAPANKLLLGLSLYGRSFTLADRDNPTIGAAVQGPGFNGLYTEEPGLLAYYEVSI